ncbi:MAG: imidazoleglycerol-phosphate dehydratase HisB [Clostridia bacterium]|nr:imidazoleglycerol-phosphate dehydratase HisB [Clostridia bacterium]
MRSSRWQRTTAETSIRIELDLDGPASAKTDTGIGFFDHMLAQLGTHGGMQLHLACDGDLEVDGHHTVEDCGIVIGQALAQALGNRSGIRRYATMFIPMDETLAVTHLDISGRPFFVFRGTIPKVRLGAFDAELCEEFFRAVAMNAGLTLHMEILYGANVHHMVEALFKSFAHALRQAAELTGRGVLSSKGML